MSLKKACFPFLLLFASVVVFGQKKSKFVLNTETQLQVNPLLLADPAVKETLEDLNVAVKMVSKDQEASKNDLSIQAFTEFSEVSTGSLVIDTVSWKNELNESYQLEKTVIKGKPVLLVKASNFRAICYAVYFLTEQVKMGQTQIISVDRFIKSPDFKFRMITQPFEAAGFAAVATLAKPIIRNREFDPMRPFDGAGYAPEDEAKNILRSGMNTLYIGGYTFATTYDALSIHVFPKGSESRKWVEERREKFRQLIAAAEKYHLQVCVNSDIFAYPKTVTNEDRYKALSTSLNEILTDFPQIDVVIGRFGENYSYFNPWFTGKGPASDTELAAVIDSIQTIVVQKYHKVFIPRTWSLGNDSWHADSALYKKITATIKADSGTIFSIKNTQTDFWRYNRFNPAIGTGTKKQAIEYLCQDGYHFKSSIPNYEVIRMAKGSKEIDKGPAGMKTARDLGVEYTWGWLTADGWCGPAIEREEWLQANIFGYTHLMWDANQDPKALAKTWAALTFKVALNSKAAKSISDILMQSEDMILKACYFKSFSTQHNGWLPALNWERDDVIGGGTKSHKNLDCQFSFGPGELKPIFNKATIDEDCRDKKQAYEIAVKMLKNYDKIMASLPDQKQAQEVRNTLVSATGLTSVINHYINGLFRYYNGEQEEAKIALEKWQVAWKEYNEVTSKLPGAPTPMTNGGMVETSEEILKELTR
jgi:hypothetical protein